MAEPQALLVAAQLADALRHLSELGVAHRDLKPDNVLFVSAARAQVSAHIAQQNSFFPRPACGWLAKANAEV